eukprot:1195816-Prorocentrum_minimum.AAC.12
MQKQKVALEAQREKQQLELSAASKERGLANSGTSPGALANIFGKPAIPSRGLEGVFPENPY